MTIQELKDYYGNAYKFNKATGISAQSFHNWVRWGFVPTFSQLKIERITEGKFKAEWKDEK